MRLFRNPWISSLVAAVIVLAVGVWIGTMLPTASSTNGIGDAASRLASQAQRAADSPLVVDRNGCLWQIQESTVSEITVVAAAILVGPNGARVCNSR